MNELSSKPHLGIIKGSCRNTFTGTREKLTLSPTIRFYGQLLPNTDAQLLTYTYTFEKCVIEEYLFQGWKVDTL